MRRSVLAAVTSCALLLAGTAQAVTSGRGCAVVLVAPANQVDIGTIAPDTLMRGYHSIYYQRDPASGTIVLTTTATAPKRPQDAGPITALREQTGWNPTQTAARMTETLQINHLPDHGNLIVGRLVDENAALATIETDGNRVIAHVHTSNGLKNLVVGAIAPRNAVRALTYSLETVPTAQGVMLAITANGTRSVFPLAATTAAVRFEASAGESQPWPVHRTDYARVIITALSMTHEAS